MGSVGSGSIEQSYLEIPKKFLIVLMNMLVPFFSAHEGGARWRECRPQIQDPNDKENPEIQRSCIANSPVDFQGLHFFPVNSVRSR